MWTSDKDFLDPHWTSTHGLPAERAFDWSRSRSILLLVGEMIPKFYFLCLSVTRSVKTKNIDPSTGWNLLSRSSPVVYAMVDAFCRVYDILFSLRWQILSEKKNHEWTGLSHKNHFSRSTDFNASLVSNDEPKRFGDWWGFSHKSVGAFWSSVNFAHPWPEREKATQRAHGNFESSKGIIRWPSSFTGIFTFRVNSPTFEL